MIGYQAENDQLLVETQPEFWEFNVLEHLRRAGIVKGGFTCAYLFQLVFVLIFHHRNWFQLLKSAKAESFPGKDAVYRFLTNLSTEVVHKTDSLTSSGRVSAFVVDDSVYERNRSKSVEFLAWFKDHARNYYYKGYRMMALAGRTDTRSCLWTFRFLAPPNLKFRA